MAPSAIFDFQKSDFSALGPLGLPIFYLGVKFGAKLLIDAEIMLTVRYRKGLLSQMTAIAI